MFMNVATSRTLLAPLVLVALLLGMCTTSASAQTRSVQQLPEQNPLPTLGTLVSPTTQTTDRWAQPLHVTDRLMSTPEAQADVAQFWSDKAAGRFLRKRPADVLAKGTTKSFNVLVDLVTGSSWTTRTFTLLATSDVANVWLDTLQTNKISQAQIDALNEALLFRTNQGSQLSYDSTKGIIELDQILFGQPPNVDGDGKVDVLVYDISEGEGADAGVYVNGFVTSADLNLSSPANRGNKADILYLDTDPTMTNPGVFGNDETMILATAAHEYQHLIHLNYDTGESLFTNEGVSEWAEVITGYQGRNLAYLGSASGVNSSLLDYRQEPASDMFFDRQRGLLFHGFIAEAFGHDRVRAVVQSPQSGYQGYVDAFGEAAAFREAISTFHLRNWINDPAFGTAYAYTTDFFSSVGASATEEVNDGRSEGFSGKSLIVKRGGVQYIPIRDLSDLTVSFEVDNGDLSSRDNVQGFAIAYPEAGIPEIRPLTRNQNTEIEGDFLEVVLVFIHNRPDQVDALVQVTGSWTSSLSNIAFESFIYDDGRVITNSSGAIRAYSFGKVARIANKFEVPDDMSLSSVSVSPFYENVFSGSTARGARDFELVVWTVGNNGYPDQELFSLTQTDTRTITAPTLAFVELDMRGYSETIGRLPREIFVGLRDPSEGTDTNYLVHGVSNGDGDEQSVLYLDNFGPGWAYFENIFTTSGTDTTYIFEDTVWPIRATFQSGLSVDRETMPEVPEGSVALGAIYPSPTASVAQLPMTVREPVSMVIKMFDVLGREVHPPSYRTFSAGAHVVSLDGLQDVAAGLYFIHLETPETTLVRSVVKNR